MPERRYDENETAEIFARAAEAPPTGQRALPAGEGMTLVELQEIGRQAGPRRPCGRGTPSAAR